jgi:hypothetical protein
MIFIPLPGDSPVVCYFFGAASFLGAAAFLLLTHNFRLAAFHSRSRGEHGFQFLHRDRRLDGRERRFAVRQDPHALRRLDVANMQRFVHAETCDVRLYEVRDLIGQAFDLQLAHPVLQDASFLHAGGAPY